MEKYLTLMNEEYKKKYYTNGFEEGVHKNTNFCGKVLCVVAIILLVLFIPFVMLGLWFIITSSGDGDLVVTGLIIAGIGLFFVIPAIVVFYFGKKFLRRTPESILAKSAKDNNCSESIIREYMNQVLNSDTYILHIAGRLEAKSNIGTGFLTRDFLALGAITKRSDIIAVRLVNVSDVYGVGYKIKTKYILTITFLCRDGGCLSSSVKKDAAKELIAIIIAQNPHIDVNLEKILTEKEFKQFKQETLDHLQ